MKKLSLNLHFLFVFLRVHSWLLLLLLLQIFLCSGCGPPARPLLFCDDFKSGLNQWTIELENGGVVRANHGVLDIDVPAGATVWFKPLLHDPVMIEYRATAISNGGRNDRVSDLNCFWMARDARSPDDLFATHRTGKFADYNQLLCYYVGLGGNSNTTTRFRRYIGSPTTRPLLPEHDLKEKDTLLTANQTQTITIRCDNHQVSYARDGKVLFNFVDKQPYTSGWFAFRTVNSHLRIQDFKVYDLK